MGADPRAGPTRSLKVGQEHHGAAGRRAVLGARRRQLRGRRRARSLGIIGRNGAGKSTLLKILSQVTAPTSRPDHACTGRVASLLEVGTGFHPELTGRENVFLNGAILGMTKAEIRRKFDEIVAFSECEEFIDTPVKRYSSGMYVRLAFAVAAHLEPEILIVDEVLAVGDAQFQKKCLGKMGEVSRQRTHGAVRQPQYGGRPEPLPASHPAARRTAGDQGPATSVVSPYLRDAYPRDGPRRGPRRRTRRATALRVRSVGATPVDHRSAGLIGMDSPVRIDTDFWVLKPGRKLTSPIIS